MEVDTRFDREIVSKCMEIGDLMSLPRGRVNISSAIDTKRIQFYV